MEESRKQVQKEMFPDMRLGSVERSSKHGPVGAGLEWRCRARLDVELL